MFRGVEMDVTYRPVKALLKYDYRIVLPIKPDKTLKYKRITLHTDGLLVIKRGYCWDHASGAFDTKSIVEGALVHDALCELIHNELLHFSYWNAVADIMYVLNRGGQYPMCILRALWINWAIKIAGVDVTVARKYITV